MNAFLNPHNGTSLTGITDVTAHSISIYQENEPRKIIEGIFIPKNDIILVLLCLMMSKSMS